MSALTEAMRRGDEAAYRAFHEQYFCRLSRYLLVIARGNEHAARDAVLETYRRVVKHVRRFDCESTFWSWLTVLARTALADQRRRERRYLSFLDRFRRDNEIGAAAQLQADEEHADNLLADALHTLPTDERQLIQWKYFNGAPVRDIAERLCTTESAIESRLVRIRRKLRDLLLHKLQREPNT